jgi:hypothetical protein
MHLNFPVWTIHCRLKPVSPPEDHAEGIWQGVGLIVPLPLGVLCYCSACPLVANRGRVREMSVMRTRPDIGTFIDLGQLGLQPVFEILVGAFVATAHVPLGADQYLSSATKQLRHHDGGAHGDVPGIAER